MGLPIGFPAGAFPDGAFPDGASLNIGVNDVFWTLYQLNLIFQKLVIMMLGLDPTQAASAQAVRLAWPEGGAPAWGINDDICFLKILEIDTPYNRQRDISYSMYDANNANQAMSYTRMLALNLVFYGPDSFDHAQIIRDQLFYALNRNILALNNLYSVPDTAAPRRNPEPFQGQWWERTDMTLYFYEKIVRNTQIQYAESVEVQLMDAETGANRIDKDLNI